LWEEFGGISGKKKKLHKVLVEGFKVQALNSNPSNTKKKKTQKSVGLSVR
jgi:hypothetical protein